MVVLRLLCGGIDERSKTPRRGGNDVRIFLDQKLNARRGSTGLRWVRPGLRLSFWRYHQVHLPSIGVPRDSRISRQRVLIRNNTCNDAHAHVLNRTASGKATLQRWEATVCKSIW